MNPLKASKYDGSSAASGFLLLSSLRNIGRFGKESDKIYQTMLY